MNWYNWSSRCRQNQMKNLFIFVKKKKSKPKLTRYQHLRPPPGVASFPRSFSSSIFWPSLPPAPILNTIGAGCFAIFPGLICYSWASHLHCPCPRGGKWKSNSSALRRVERFTYMVHVFSDPCENLNMSSCKWIVLMTN